MNECPSCGAVMDCSEPLTAYSIQSPVFPILFVCPSGRDCTLGSSFHLVCCSQDIAIEFPAGFDKAQKQQIVNNAIAECQRQALFCNNCPNPPCPPPCPNPPCVTKVYWNDAQSCTAKCSDGIGFYYTVSAGVYVGTDLAVVNNMAFKQACALAKDHKICLSDLSGAYCADIAQSFEIRATGKYLAVSPFSDYWSVSGTIPTGMTFHGGLRTDGKSVIDGTPTTGGVYTFTVTVTQQTPGPAFGDYTSRTYTIKIAQIKPDTLPDGKVGDDYSQELTVDPDHDATTEVWTLTSGALPGGITLDSDGTLAGIPNTNTNATYHPTFQVAFTLDGKTVTCSKEYSLVINAVVPTVTGYWALEQVGVGVARLDSTANHLDLETEFPTPDVSAFLAGKIVSGARNTFAAGDNRLVSILGSNLFGHLENGFSMCGWFRMSDMNWDGDTVLWAVNSSVYSFFLQIHSIFSLPFLRLATSFGSSFGPSEIIVILPNDTNWHFIRAWFDPSDNKSRLQVDTSAIFESNILNPVNTGNSGSFQILGGNSSSFDIYVDEIGYWQAKVLSNLEASALYNGGAGVTWPNIP